MGKNVTCPSHEDEGHCSANITMDQSIGDEKTWASECAKGIIGTSAIEPLTFNYFVSDGDSRAFDGVKQVQMERLPTGKMEHFRDTRHMSKNQRTLIKNATFSAEMIPHRRKDIREKLQNRFALEVSQRCAAEFNVCFKKFGNDVDTMVELLSKTTSAIMECYKGNCALCVDDSFVCRGNKWNSWEKSCLPSGFHIKPNANDECILKKCIEYRIGEKGIKMTRRNLNSQKVEACNRCYSASDPKITTRSRNFPGRIHSAAHKLNHGIASSTVMKLEHVSAPLAPGSKVVHQLHKTEVANRRRRLYNLSDKAKSQRIKKKKTLFGLYDQKNEKVGYVSGMLDSNYTVTDFTCSMNKYKSKCKTVDCTLKMTKTLHNYAKN